MGKYGKRNMISKKITDYSFVCLGSSGVGKTTLMVNVCHKLVGDEGYIIFNMGKEDGVACIDDAIYENIENWKKLDEVIKDIIRNKLTDYPDLKIIVIDTIDQMFELAEQEVIRLHNIEKRNEKNFTPITTINAAFGGYGQGLERSCQLVLDKIWELKKAGITVWMCGHTKTKDIVDPLTDQTYSTISANLSQKYFNAIKTKVHVVGMAVIDRDIVTEAVGRKDINNKEVTRNKIASEARKIIFRDDNFSVDSKSRFADIVDEIPLDADAFIKAMQDAIYKADKHEQDEDTPLYKSESKPVKESVTEEDPDLIIPDEEELAPEVDIPALQAQVRKLIKANAGTDKYKQAAAIVKQYGNLSAMDVEGLNEVIAILEE